MPLSVRRRIAAHLVQALEGITHANGFSTEVVAVLRGLTTPQDQVTPFVCLVMPGEEPYDDSLYPMLSKRLPFQCVAELEVMEGAGEGRADEAEKLLADMELALLADPSRGGLAVNTRLLTNRIFADDPGEPWVEVQLSGEVLYRVRRGDPYVAV